MAAVTLGQVVICFAMEPESLKDIEKWGQSYLCATTSDGT